MYTATEITSSTGNSRIVHSTYIVPPSGRLDPNTHISHDSYSTPSGGFVSSIHIGGGSRSRTSGARGGGWPPPEPLPFHHPSGPRSPFPPPRRPALQPPSAPHRSNPTPQPPSLADPHLDGSPTLRQWLDESRGAGRGVSRVPSAQYTDSDIRRIDNLLEQTRRQQRQRRPESAASGATYHTGYAMTLPSGSYSPRDSIPRPAYPHHESAHPEDSAGGSRAAARRSHSYAYPHHLQYLPESAGMGRPPRFRPPEYPLATEYEPARGFVPPSPRNPLVGMHTSRVPLMTTRSAPEVHRRSQHPHVRSLGAQSDGVLHPRYARRQQYPHPESRIPASPYHDSRHYAHPEPEQHWHESRADPHHYTDDRHVHIDSDNNIVIDTYNDHNDERNYDEHGYDEESLTPHDSISNISRPHEQHHYQSPNEHFHEYHAYQQYPPSRQREPPIPDQRVPHHPSHLPSPDNPSSSSDDNDDDEEEAENPPHHDRPPGSYTPSILTAEEELCRDDAALAAMLQDLEIRRSQVGRYADDDDDDENHDDHHDGGRMGRRAEGKEKAEDRSRFKQTRFAPDVGRAGSAP